MQFNNHFSLLDRHAFLSASTYSWIRYDDDKFDARWFTAQAAQRGTDLHNLAKEMIRLGVKLPNTKKTLNSYVNDCIGFKMSPEVVLFYSDNCFGTADAIGFKKNTLRIFDLKTGITKASVDQLLIYAALFCFEYRFKPFEIEYDLRIYQNDEIIQYDVDPDDVMHIMDRIQYFDKRINGLKQEALA